MDSQRAAAAPQGNGNIKLGIAAVVAASVLFSAKSVFFKLCYRYGTAPIVLQSLRGIFSLPFFIWPFLARFFGPDARRLAPLGRKDLGIIVWLGFSGYYLASIFDMVGLQYVTAGTERLILYVYPTLVVIFSALIFRKPIKRMLYFPLALSYAGIALSFGGEASLGAGGHPWTGGALVFASAVFYALFLVWQGRLVHRYGPAFFAAGCMAASFMFVLAQFFLTHPMSDLAQPRPVLWIAAFTAVFCNVIPVYLYGYGVRLVGAGRSAVASSVGPVSTLILSGSLLGEHAGWMQILGLGLVVAGTLKLGLGGSKPAGPPPDQGRGGSGSSPSPVVSVSGIGSGSGSGAGATSGSGSGSIGRPASSTPRKGSPATALSDPAVSAAAFLAASGTGAGAAGALRGHSHARRE